MIFPKKLEENIKSGNTVLFLGAGVGVAVGLYSTSELADFIFKSCGSPQKFVRFKDNFYDLVARLDDDAEYTRVKVNKAIYTYFSNRSNYKDLEIIKKLLKRKWASLYTTNYDLSIEFANEEQQGFQNLNKIINPNEKFAITDDNPFNLRYLKLHGCAKDILDNEDSQRLVITKKDFAQSTLQKGNFWKELERACYHKSILFLGFQADNHSTILETLEYAKQQISLSTEMPIQFYAVLKNATEDTVFDLKQLDITVLDGDFQDFVETVDELEFSEEIYKPLLGQVTILNTDISMSENEKYEYNKQFYFFYENFFIESVRNFEALSINKKLDLWKSNPSQLFIYSGRCIERSQHQEIHSEITKLISSYSKVSKKRLLIYGDRGCGKSVLIKQLAKDIALINGNPVLILNDTAIYEENIQGEIHIMSGWNYRQFDKYLSQFNINTNHPSSIPIIIADNVYSKIDQLEKLIENLNNHSKPNILIMTCATDEYESVFDNKMSSNADSYFIIKLQNILNDQEVNKLFLSVSNDKPLVLNLKEELIQKAKDDLFGKRDLLLVLYMWFDERYRRFDEIVVEEADKITNSSFKNLFLSIAVFQQFGLRPPIEICAIGVHVSSKTYHEYLDLPLFKALITFEAISNSHYAITRHSIYTEKILKNLLPVKDDQISLMCNVLKKCEISDLDFVRSVFLKLCKHVSYRIQEIRQLKIATEEVFDLEKDYVLNHQYASFLIRELDSISEQQKEDFVNDIIYYLDKALIESEDNPAIIHSKGNLESKLYQMTDNEIYYDQAIEYFNRVKAIRTIPDEYNYVTEIDLMSTKIDKNRKAGTEKIDLELERSALIMEAVTVVPKENHNIIIRRSKEYLKDFTNLNSQSQQELIAIIDSGDASYTLINYYAQHLLLTPKSKSWKRLRDLVTLYFSKEKSIECIIASGIISKKAFILDSSTRFDLMRQYFEDIIQNERYPNLNNILKSEYLKTISIDAFVLKRFDLLRKMTLEYTRIYRYNFAKYLTAEFILKPRFYIFDRSDEINCIKLFELYDNEHQKYIEAEFFKRQINLSNNPNLNDFFKIEMDLESGFFIKGISYELQKKDRQQIIGFNIKFDSDGFKAANIKSF